MDTWLERLLQGAGLIGALVCFPLLVVISIYDIVGRQFMNTGSTALQEMQWHLFFASVLLSIGWVYLRDGHVRIDVFRARWPEGRRTAVEIAGVVLALVPFAALLIWAGGWQTWIAFVSDEHSAAALGLGRRWIVKSAMPVGGLLLLAAGFLVVRRAVARSRSAAGSASDLRPGAGR